MGREVRRVPAHWEHPKYPSDPRRLGGMVPTNRAGGYRPMYAYDFDECVEEWKRELQAWMDNYDNWEAGKPGTYHTEEDIEKYVYFDTYAGPPPPPPNPYEYMGNQDLENGWYALYETVSEGTPLSPSFETAEELVDWLATNKDYWGHTRSRENAEGMVRHGWAPSMIFSFDTIYTPETMNFVKAGDDDA